jgi:hypothetical protein
MTRYSACGALARRTARLQTMAAVLAVALALSVCALPAAAQTLPIPGQVNAGGPAVTIGTLSAAVTGGGSESATFTLNQQFRNLLSDANGTQFRFFQAATSYSILPSYNPVTHAGGVLAPNNPVPNTADVVDPPSGGWNYEWTTGTKGGDDTSPFYERDTLNNPAGNPYFAPGLTYPALHSADGVNPGTMSTRDGPKIPAGNQVQFVTFIAYETQAMLTARQVDILGGYSWGVQTTAAGVQTGTAPTYIADSAITPAMVTQYGAALALSGFAGWSITASDTILTTFAPEPSGLTIAAIAGALCGAWGLMRRGFGRRRERAVRL